MIKKSISEIKARFGICLKSIFFLLLGVSSNFIGDTFGCQLQKILNENLICKQILIFLTIYFGLDLSSDSSLDPKNGIMLSAFVYTFYLVFTHMDHRITLVSFCLLASIYFFDKNIKFYKDKISKKKLEKNSYIRDQLIKILLITIVIGFLMQINLRYNDYYKLNVKDGFLYWYLMNNKNCSNLV